MEKAFDDDDTEWIPISPCSNMKTDGPVPTTPTDLLDHDNDAGDDAGTRNTEPPPAQVSLESDTSYSTPTKSDINGSESSRWVTPTTEKKIPTPPPAKHSPNGHSDTVAPMEPAPQLLPTVHRYRGSLTIGTPVTPRNYNSSYSISNNPLQYQGKVSSPSGHNNKVNGHIKGSSFDKLALPIKTESPRTTALSVSTATAETIDLSSSESSNSPSNSNAVDEDRVKLTSFVGSNDNTDKDEEDSDDDYDDEVVFVGDVNEIPLPPPADVKLNDMTNIVTKRLVGISMQDFYDVCWSDATGAAFYRSWLQNRGNSQVTIQDWDYPRNGQDFVGSWCGESYKQQRLVTFQYQRKSDLHSGSLDATVQQMQMCQREGNDKMVVTMQIDTGGIPFADHFQIHVRWIVTRIPASDHLLSVHVGVVVEVIKPTVLAGKLQSELIQQTTKEQLDLFKNMKKACTKWAERQSCRDILAITNQPIPGLNLPPFLLNFLKLHLHDKRLPSSSSRRDDVRRQIHKAEERLRQISTWLEKSPNSNDNQQLDDARTQLEKVNQILDQLASKL